MSISHHVYESMVKQNLDLKFEIKELNRRVDISESSLASILDFVNTFAREENIKESYNYLTEAGNDIKTVIASIIFKLRKKNSSNENSSYNN